MIWVQTGELDESNATWHLAWERGLDSYIDALCGIALARGNQWVRGDEEGWRWVRKYRSMICLECIDALERVTIMWDAKGIFVKKAG